MYICTYVYVAHRASKVIFKNPLRTDRPEECRRHYCRLINEQKALYTGCPIANIMLSLHNFDKSLTFADVNYNTRVCVLHVKYVNNTVNKKKNMLLLSIGNFNMYEKLKRTANFILIKKNIFNNIIFAQRE